MAGDISLSTATRSNLLSLQRTTGLIGRTQERLATGLKVNSAIDDALAFFKARNLNARAEDLSAIKDDISNGISVIRAAVQGLEAIESTLKQMKALAQSAISSPESSTRSKLAETFNELRSQVDNLTEDASFNGVNLLKNNQTAFQAGADNLTVRFNERQDDTPGTGTGPLNQLVVSGVSNSDFATILATSAVATGTAGTTAGLWGQTGTAAVTAINNQIRAVESALVTVRQVAQELGTNSSMLEIRKNFTQDLVNTLKGGASDLVNADLNEESANLLSLQTRQQLGTISLGIAQQSEQSVLRLF
ncbi:MAG: flagellin [Alphaproteobacteria bacterium]|nr:flagellin [Alphaproteobacteria bacterium]